MLVRSFRARVYRIPLDEILEERGFEVHLVNARHTKNLPGRKSDVQESQWSLKLHTYGLLSKSFQPVSEIRRLRTYGGNEENTCVERRPAFSACKKALLILSSHVFSYHKRLCIGSSFSAAC